MPLEPIPVAKLNQYLKTLLENDALLSQISVVGEVSNFKVYQMGQTAYFTLKDADAAISCVIFSSVLSKMKFQIEDGQKLIVAGRVSFFNKRGTLNLQVFYAEPEGKGALALAFEQLKHKLEVEGLFDPAHKKPIPQFPKRIAMISSPSGAAVHDVINILKRRAPQVELLIIPAVVQGADAPASIVRAVNLLKTIPGIDTLIVGRGGGSLEELWAFNTEEVARAVYACDVPVISAVGHEVDFTICDFVADLRAPTPSAAAELAVPDTRELILSIEDNLRRLGELLLSRVQIQKQQFQNLLQKIQHAMALIFQDKKNQLQSLYSQLESLSPLKVLERGYAVLQDENQKVIRSVADVENLQTLQAILKDGKITVTVKI
jgi:exodeoxyribonuclease VII large subunit